MTDRTTAVGLAARGFRVFPIVAGQKAPPFWADWPNRSSTTIPTDWPAGANVGIHCDGLVVIDVDPRKGGNEALLTLDLGDTPLSPTLEAMTPSGGRHMFYALPAGHPGVPNRVNALGAGIDIRSTGGYVVGAGSRLANGIYEWRNPDAPIAPAPEWLILKLGTNEPKLGTPAVIVPDADLATVERAQAWLATRPGAVEGQGGDAWTFATAAFLRDYGLSRGQTLDLMLGWNTFCSPPWMPDELGTKVDNAYQYATGEAGIKAVTADDFPTVPNVGTSMQVPTSAPKRSGPISFGELVSRPSDGAGYVVKGTLYKAAYSMLYGAPGEGKTFVALDLAYHVAAGKEWMGRKVKQGTVLYVGFEAYGGLGNRARALSRKYEADAPLYFTPGGFDLRLPEGRRTFGAILAELPEKPSLIVFDTFAYALANGDENSSQDVGAFNSAVQALINSTGACVLIIHHTGKDVSKGARGSSALPAALDTEMLVADRTITPTKQRDVELGEAIGFKLQNIQIGVDDDGDPILSCVVEEATMQAARSTPRRGTNEERVWAELNERRPNNDPIALLELQDYCAVFLPKGDTRLRQAFRDALRALRERGLIEIDENNQITRRME